MGEGFTPLLVDQIDGHEVSFKVEFASPSLSFKDRGAVILVAHAVGLGVRHAVADSSGNAGAAISAYAARAGIECTVFVPEGTSPKKIAQMAMHGAVVITVPGRREDAARAAIEEVSARGAFYASHVYNPYFIEGVKTYGYEVCEQLGWSAPETLVIPVGNGTLLLAAYRAFRELHAAGVTDRLPRLLAVQAAACAPIGAAFAKGATTVAPVASTGTLAEGIAIGEPARGNQILEAVYETDGWVISVEDDELLAAQKLLARRGLSVEHTAAAPLAGLLKAEAAGLRPGQAVVPLAGAGLKSA